MADPVPADDAPNAFDKLAPRPVAEAVPVAPAPAAAPANDDTAENPFDKLAPRPVAEGTGPPGSSSATGAFMRGAERGALPAAGGFVGMGAGAELGAAAGALGGPFAPLTVPAGAIVGGIAGAFVGATAVDTAQNWLLSKAPDSWKEAIGQDERQRKLDETQHPYASFLGGITPFVATMRPGPLLGGVLPENATALQRILANPMTARMFGGGAMGGIEIGQEIASGETPDWMKVGIATGFGFVFNKPTQLGQSLTELGARPARALVGARPAATVAQAGDMKVLGPGINEDVFMGTHQMAAEAEGTARATAQTEKNLIEPPAAPEIHATARQLEPELFEHYDALAAQREGFRNWLEEHANPPDEHVQEASGRIDALEKQLAEHVEDQKGYTGGPDARRLRAQLRDAESQRDLLLTRRANYIEGRSEESPEAAQVRKHLLDVDYQMRDLAPDVSAAYRRAAEHAGTETVPAEAVQPEVAVEAPAAEPVPAIAGEAAPPALKAIAEQRVFIAADVARKLVAAGRPEAEATAAGHIYAAQMATRAARFGGKRGTPEELYAAEGAEIRGDGQPVVAAVPSSPLLTGTKEIGRNSSGERLFERPDGGRVALGAGDHPFIGPKTEGRWQVEAASVLPKGYEGWTPGATVKIGPIAGMTVVSEEGGRFILQKGTKTYSFEPPKKIVKEKTGLEMLEGLREITEHEMTQRDLSQDALGKIRVGPNQRSVITIMQDANASTAIHEFGHDFFEQLARDAGHPEAPESLKTDAATARKWAGAAEQGRINKRAHEKFARGFEQYLREGVAPLRELAGIFSQFKNWLLDIYKTIRGLGAPINDDIRGVFDRLLAEEPNHTVIAPETERGPMISDIHEADAAHTEPAQADPVADRVASERAQIIEEPPPQVRNEIETAIAKDDAEQAAQPGGENAGGIERPAEVVSGSGEPGTKPAGGGVGEGRGEIGGGGGKAAPEGGGVSGSEQRRSTGPGAGPPLAPTSAPLLGGDSPLVDKAGNIRLENLTNEADVRQSIRDSAERNNEFIGARDGVVTDGMVMDMAAAIGMEGAETLVRKWVVGQSYNAGQVMAIRKLAVQSSTEVARLSKIAATGADADVLAFMQEVTHHDMIVKTLAGATAEAGRALRAFRNISEGEAGGGADPILRDSAGMTLFQARRLAKLTSTLDTPEQVSKQMQSVGKRTFGRMILEEWINALISGPATHSTYAIGNTLLALEKAGPETAVAAVIGRVRSAMGREGETVRMGEVAAGIKGGLQGISPAMKAGFDALRTGVTTALPGESLRSRLIMPFQPGTELVQPAILDEAAKFSDAMASAFGVVRGLRDGIVASGALLKAGGEAGAPLIHGNYSQLGAIPDIAIRGATVLPIGSAIRLPSRAIAGIHSFFRSVNYSIEKSAGAYRIAANEGHTGEAFDARVAHLWQNPSEGQIEAYRHEATELTLMGQGSKFTQALGRLTNTEVFGFPILKFIDPFVHISSNVIDQSIIQRTPVGLLSPELRADLLGKNGNIAQDKAQARMLVGTALAVTFGGLAAQGVASGSGPSNPREAATWRLAGNQAHSVRIGDIWYDMHRLGPLGMLMSIGADMYEVAHIAEKGEFLHAAAHFQHSLTANVLDESFMRGPSDLIKAIEDPGRYGDAYIRNFLSSFVPYSVGLAQIDRGIDPYSRQARTVVDAMKAKIPWVSQGLLPRRDIWGEAIPSRDALLVAGATAIYETHVSTDPVNLAMVQLGVFPAQPERKIRNVQLTDEQFDYYSMISGRAAKMRLDAIVRSPDWQMMPNHIRHDIIQEQISQSRNAAREVMIARDPTIAVRAIQQKADKAQGVQH